MKRLVILAFGSVSGLLLWEMSWTVFGAIEPIDSSSPTFLVAVFAIGAICGLLDQEGYWMGPLGVYLGQLVAVIIRFSQHQTPGDVVALRVLFLISVSLPAVVGGVVAAGVRALVLAPESFRRE